MSAARRIVLAVAFLFAGQALAQDHLPAPVIQALARAEIPLASVAVFAQQVDAAAPLIAFNTAQPMHPASVIKLITTYAGLELLGPSYTWKTEVWLGGGLHDGVLDGDLILKGYGEPRLTIEDLWIFLSDLRARGLREIRGNLVLDRSWFEPPPYDPAQFDGEPLRPYNVGPDALLVNFKAVRFLFVPEVERSRVRIEPEPKFPQIEIVNRIRLTAGHCYGDWRAGLRRDVQSAGATTRVIFGGTMPASCGEQYWYMNLLPHAEYAGSLFRLLWKELGGTLTGSVRDGAVPPTARLFDTHESPPASQIVRDINKLSLNAMARQLFLTLSAETLKLPGREDRSARVITSWLDAKGLQFPELAMENGAGLSRSEKISAGHLGDLLLAAWHSNVMPEFVASMPIVAHDGTMRDRLRFEPVAGNAHIKTGSLRGVRSAAGYVLDHAGRHYAVVFFINHDKADAGQPAIDAFLNWVHERAAR